MLRTLVVGLGRSGKSLHLPVLARLGFRGILVEKPLAVDEEDLVEIDLLRQCWKLDVELPHSVGLALAVAGDAKVRDAGLSDMRLEDLVIPRLGSAWLSLEHETGVRTELLSDLTAPTRERRITLELERGTLIGHYSSSEADDTAQLRTIVNGRETRAVFRDDALTTFMQRAYAHFAAPGRGHGDLTLNFKVVCCSARRSACAPGWSRAEGGRPRRAATQWSRPQPSCTPGSATRQARAWPARWTRSPRAPSSCARWTATRSRTSTSASGDGGRQTGCASWRAGLSWPASSCSTRTAPVGPPPSACST